jgi:hypothetical protein
MAIPIRSTRRDEAANMGTVVETDIFIVGAGPAGGSLASFLAQNGIEKWRPFKKTSAELICRFDGFNDIQRSGDVGHTQSPFGQSIYNWYVDHVFALGVADRVRMHARYWP